MAPKGLTPLSQAWYKWKAIRFPWRKRFLVGFDLNGNTYWEFRLTSEPTSRWRRIVKYPRSTHLSAVKVSPLWHQWLRYTRDQPPSLEEQEDDVVRQVRMKQLAAAADARWEAKPRVMEDGLGAAAAIDGPPSAKKGGEDDRPGVEGQKVDPWAQHNKAAVGPGEKWQPEAWNPSSKK